MNIEKIEINGHYVWVDKDVEIKEGDWFTDDNKSLKKSYKLSHVVFANPIKIIAASPKLNLEGVPTYVEWLAEQEYPEWKHSDVDKLRDALIKGYQTAERELPTWDDVRKSIEMARNSHRFYETEQIIEQLKQEKE